MSFAYKKLNLQDVSTEQYTANKGYSSSLENLLDGGYSVLFGQRPVSGTLFSPTTSPQNPDGSYRELVYEGIKHLYYYNYITGSLTGSFFRSSSYDNFDQTNLVSGGLDTVVKQFPLQGGYRDLYGSQSLYDESIFDGSNQANLLVLDFAKDKFGSGVNPGTFKISSSQYLIKDDGLGNIYAYTASVFQAPYSGDDSNYTGVVYGPNSSSVHPLDVDNAHTTYIGNIIYSHGVAVVTHPEFLCILGSSPVAINDKSLLLNVSCSKVIDLLKNDFDDCYNIDPTTIVFHDTGSWPFNYSIDQNGFLTLTPDEISTTPGNYSLGYTVRNELGRTSNSASLELILEKENLTGSLIQIENVCFPDQLQGGDSNITIPHPQGAVTFSIDFGVPHYSWSNDGLNYKEVPDLCFPVVSGSISASLDGIIYIKDREETVYELPYSNTYGELVVNVATQSVGWCVNDPFVFPSPSATPTPTRSKTPSISISKTPSLTPTPSPSFQNTPSRTASPTPTRTASVTPSRTRTRTRSITPSISAACGTHNQTLELLNSSDCDDFNSFALLKTNNAIWSQTTLLVSAGNCSAANLGWYTDGFLLAYWGGSSFTNVQICQTGGGGGNSSN